MIKPTKPTISHKKYLKTNIHYMVKHVDAPFLINMSIPANLAKINLKVTHTVTF